MMACTSASWRRVFAALGLGLLLCAVAAADIASAQTAPREGTPTEGREVAPATPQAGNVPGGTLGSASDTELWRAIRGGIQGTVSIPDRQAGVMIQSEGDNWRAIRNGPLQVYGSWVVLGMVALLALFFLLRGRIRIDSGMSGQTIERFSNIDRFAHWMTAVSFIILAITGMNLLWGRYVLLPVLGPEIFAWLSQVGKYAHNFLAFPFMAGIALMFVLWVRHNIPGRQDLVWIAKGGGLFVKGVHPPSKKFNAGQKIIFWMVVLGGLSLSLSGIALMFPFETAMWGKTFAALNAIGFNLPTTVSPMAEMQLNNLSHSVVALVLIAVVLAHIYIGSIGMEGAFAAMGSGKVDVNWAREHHNLWTAEVLGEPAPSGGDD